MLQMHVEMDVLLMDIILIQLQLLKLVLHVKIMHFNALIPPIQLLVILDISYKDYYA